MAAAGGSAAEAQAASAAKKAAQRTARAVGQASRLPSAEGASLLGRFAARAGETPVLRCCGFGPWSRWEVVKFIISMHFHQPRHEPRCYRNDDGEANQIQRQSIADHFQQRHATRAVDDGVWGRRNR